jgi:hypothetical protein
MVEGYTIKDVLECYNGYMKNGKPKGVSVSRHEGGGFLEKEPKEGKH